MDFSAYNFGELRSFIYGIRAFAQEPADVFNTRLEALLTDKTNDEALKGQISAFAYLLLDQAFFVNAFADYGIHSDRGFFPEVYKRIKHKVLPPNIPGNELSLFIRYLLGSRKDHVWLRKIHYPNWERLLQLIDTAQITQHEEKISGQLHNAIIILGHRLTTIGIDPYLVSKMEQVDDSDSPFFELNHSVSVFVKGHLHDKTLDIDDGGLQAVLLNIDRCEKIFTEVKDKKDLTGTSLHLTFLLRRAQQHINRLRLLLDLYASKQHSRRVTAISSLIVDLVQADHEKNSVRKFMAENSDMLAYRIVSHTSEKGEHYIGFSRSENRRLMLSAMGGGLVVVFLVYIKHFIHMLHLSLFFEGLLFGLNYGLGFVFMHLAHLTLATKQPAMTASYIAESIENNPDRQARSWLVFKQIMRSQFISLAGNLVVVLPLCFLSAWLLYTLAHIQVFGPEAAASQLYSNHPFYSASLLYACITGVFLSLSGIITGYFDNKVVFSEIPERIRKHPGLSKTYSPARRERMAVFVEKNLGAIIGNLFLGFCLGMAGSIGKFIGLPFDIRHITISAGNFGIATGSVPCMGPGLVCTVFVGVLLIGIINILSSFLISFVVACKSRSLSGTESLRILLSYFSRR